MAIDYPLEDVVTFFWLFFSTVTIFWMQVGFALLEVGCSRIAHVKNLLTKNVVDGAITLVSFFAVGFALYGNSGNSFCGNKYWFFAGIGADDHSVFAQWILASAFAASSVTIVSGAVAERCRLEAYFCISALLSAFVYSIAGHWVWSTEGWLSAYNSSSSFNDVPGFLDYAGGVVVHALGGTAALISVYVLGPRYGRFGVDGVVVELTGQIGNSSVFRVCGALILFIAFITFNASSVQIAERIPIASLIAVNTVLSAAASCMTVMAWKLFVRRCDSTYKFDAHFAHSIDGLLAGCVAATASGPFVEPWAAFVIGIIAGVIYDITADVVLKLKLDDVVNAVAIHLTPGIWGAIAVGFFAKANRIRAAYSLPEYDAQPPRPPPCASGSQATVVCPACILEARACSDTDVDRGVLMGGDGRLLGVQLLGSLVIFSWTAAITTPLLLLLHYLGWLRLATDAQISMHSGLRQVNDVAQLRDDWSSEHTNGKSGKQLDNGGRRSSTTGTTASMTNRRPAIKDVPTGTDSAGVAQLPAGDRDGPVAESHERQASQYTARMDALPV